MTLLAPPGFLELLKHRFAKAGRARAGGTIIRLTHATSQLFTGIYFAPKSPVHKTNNKAHSHFSAASSAVYRCAAADPLSLLISRCLGRR
jgi:hypothetical protein